MSTEEQSLPVSNSNPQQNSDISTTAAQLKSDIQTLLHLINSRKKACDATAEETRYMREYVESFISMTDMSKKSRKWAGELK